ncbi:hypothetical protein DAPPUDRAFT_118061 [Daphnia pulex]|uniref:Uncharacterized protein n=1 Tax=Daphnia pulex TaxID=6669 RepID=E9HUK5_DAPPU|nr:hypothetical protein DAPPUDRAFT_118061 [Daphnia pulex]|eukprot:EFX64579.1 hypothetical protein DAPPUDRAFT_118061 [Daphnia pulex]
MKTKMCIVRPSSPWFSGEISAARRRCRKLERVWRRRRLTIDKDILLHHIRQLRKLMNDTKASFFKSKIDEMGNDRRGLFQLLDRCLSRDKVSKLPVHADPATLADRFGRYFDEKIVNIRANLDAKNAPSADSSSSAPNSFLSVFELVLPAEICEIVDKCPANTQKKGLKRYEFTNAVQKAGRSLFEARDFGSRTTQKSLTITLGVPHATDTLVTAENDRQVQYLGRISNRLW